MRISLEKIGKQFQEEWVFQNISFEFKSGVCYAVLGPNGSGKSTLINIISSHMLPTAGNLDYLADSKKIPKEEIYKHISVCSPYIELVEEFTLSENISLFNSFKKFIQGIDPEYLISLVQSDKSRKKKIGQFSSGMKQRVKLALALLADVPVVLLDEPCMNMDAEGIEWYKKLISTYAGNRLIIVSSNNREDEYGFCSNTFLISNFK